MFWTEFGFVREDLQRLWHSRWSEMYLHLCCRDQLWWVQRAHGWHHILQATQAGVKFLWVILHCIAVSWWNINEFSSEWLKGIYLLASYFHWRFYVGKPAHMSACHRSVTEAHSGQTVQPNGSWVYVRPVKKLFFKVSFSQDHEDYIWPISH